MPKLTKRYVDSLKPDPKGKDNFVWDEGDGALKGFGIRIKPSGAASYFVQYRNQEGRTRRLVIGKVNVLAPDEARNMAANKLKAVPLGGDPSAERHAIRNSTTVSELCDLYIEDAGGRIKDSTLAGDKSRIETHVKPLLGRKSVRSLTIEDLEKFQADISLGKTAKPRTKTGRGGNKTGGRGVAARTLGMVGTILEFAKRRRLITENPARAVRKNSDVKKDRFLNEDEIKALGKAIREAAVIEKASALAAIRTLLLTGCRKNEILSLPWAWVDQKAQCIRFGDTKSGAQLRVIGKNALNHIKAQPREKDAHWVFPATRGEGHFIGLPNVLERICKEAKLQSVTLHTFRHTFAATAASLGFSELTIAGLLGHKVPGITARYAHMPDTALILAADKVAAHIADVLDGKVKKQNKANKSKG